MEENQGGKYEEASMIRDLLMLKNMGRMYSALRCIGYRRPVNKS